jgi:hypothetical protein
MGREYESYDLFEKEYNNYILYLEQQKLIDELYIKLYDELYKKLYSDLIENIDCIKIEV